MGLTLRHAELLEARGLDIELLERLGIASCERHGPDTIAIPYHSGETVVGTKYRTIAGDKVFSQEIGSAQILYNRDCLLDRTLYGQPVVICEGEIDCWSALQCGFVRSVSVPAGAPSTEVGDRASAKYDFIADMPELPEDTVFILAVDSDGPGQALRADLALRLKARRCKSVKYPQGCKDLNDALRIFGPKGVVASLNRAEWIVGNVYRMSDAPLPPPAQPYDSGFPGLAPHYRLRLGDFCVATGVPSSGKTTFVQDLCCRMVQAHRWPVCFASFEESLHDLRTKLRSWHGGGLAKDLDVESMGRADAWIDQFFSFIVPDDDSYPTLEWVLERFAASALRYGTRLYVLDPWNEVEHDRPDGITLTEYVGAAIRQLKAFARKYEAHLIVVAHPAKLRRDADGHYPVPTLYDISDSAHWYNKADVGVVVHRKSEEETMIRIAKSRFHNLIGKPGDVSVRYVWQRATFEQFGLVPVQTWHDRME